MKQLLFALCLLSLSYTTKAQTSSTPTTEKKKKGNVVKELNLDETQKKTVATIRKTDKVQIDSIKNNTALTEAQKQSEIKKVKQEERKKVEALLTTEQKAKLAELQPKKKGKKN